MRNRFETQFLHQLGHVFQQRDDATIVLLLMRLEHQQREQLWLRELLRTESMRVLRERSLAHLQRFQRDSTRRL